MPRKSSASRARTRRIGLLGLLLTTALTPAGIMVGTVTAAALIGGLAFHLNRAAPGTPSTPVSAKAGNPQRLTIERDGKTVSLVMTEDELAGGGSVGTFDPAGPLFAGLAGDGPAQRTAPGGMPPHASPGTSTPGGGTARGGATTPGGAHPPTGPASNSPSFAGPIGAPPGAGSPPVGSPHSGASPGGHPAATSQPPTSRQPAGPNGTPPAVATLPTGSPPSGASPSPQPAPIRVAQPHSPGVNDAPAQPPGEAGGPASPHETTQPPHGGMPQETSPPPNGNAPLGDTPHEPTQPPHGMPQDTLPASSPGTLAPPLADEPFGPLTPPSDKEVTAQPNAVPEPSMMGLILLGVAAMAWAGRRRANPLRLA